jgi:hypothetical protein
VAIWGYELLGLARQWNNASWYLAVDYQLYMDATTRWLDGGSFYLPHQLAGPYVVTHGDILYPPYSLMLFVPFTVVPAIFWWAIPLTITITVVVHHRPSPLTWPVIAFCLAWPTTNLRVLAGNPVLWVMAAFAAGTVMAWPSVMVLLKPSLFPFALVGIWRRSWWRALASLAAVSLVFLPMWPDYLKVIGDSSNPRGLAYSIYEIPMLLIPLVAWLGGRLRPTNRAAPIKSRDHDANARESSGDDRSA